MTSNISRLFSVRSVACLALAVVAIVALVLPVSAMIKALTIDELVRASDFVVIATMQSKTEVSVNSEQISTMKNVLKLDKILKGTLKDTEPITVFTQQRGAYGEIGSLEDQVEFPAAGKKVMLFLKQLAPGRVDLINGMQGMWPMDGQTLLGFGTGIQLQAIVDTIKHQSAN